MSRDGVSNDSTRVAEFYTDTSRKKLHNKNRPPSAALVVRWPVADSSMVQVYANGGFARVNSARRPTGYGYHRVARSGGGCRFFVGEFEWLVRQALSA